MQDGGGGEKHTEVVRPLCVVQVCGVEDGAAETDEEEAGVGEGVQEGGGAADAV